MSAGLLAELARLGVRVERDGDRLLLDGPDDVLTDALLAEIAAAKLALLAALDGGAEAAPDGPLRMTRCLLAGCAEPAALGDLAYCADHRRAADDGTLWLRCVFHPDRPVAPGDAIACAECRAKLDALDDPARPELVLTSASPWRCYACRGTRRSHRPAWGDWTCDRCRVIVAGPNLTERPWRRVRQYGPWPMSTAPRVAWGQGRGYIAVHDVAPGTWHEIAYRDAPAAWQAAVRHGRVGRKWE